MLLLLQVDVKMLLNGNKACVTRSQFALRPSPADFT